MCARVCSYLNDTVITSTKALNNLYDGTIRPWYHVNNCKWSPETLWIANSSLSCPSLIFYQFAACYFGLCWEFDSPESIIICMKMTLFAQGLIL